MMQYQMQNLSITLQHLYETSKPYLQQGEYGLSVIEYYMYEYFPQLLKMNNFQKFLILNAILIGLVVAIKLIKLLNPINIYHCIVKIIFSLPWVQNKVKKQLEDATKQFLDSYPQQLRAKRFKIPYKPQEPDISSVCETETKNTLSGCRYPEKKHSDFIANLAKHFSYVNPLHFDLHPYSKQMEVEVIRMCAKMLNFYGEKQISNQHQVVGGFFSGGTESILMAILAYREYGFKCRGVKNPNMIICNTGHAAALKAADYFQIEVRVVGTDSEERMSISEMKRSINSDTICVYTSYPNFPYGSVDPVESIAKICEKKGVPVHIDMCLGGFLVPFLKDKDGKPMLTIPKGITSISMDCHKYGLSAKGASVLLFSSQKIRKHHLYVAINWPGGLYGTIGISGSRSAIGIVSAWISMLKMGIKGFQKNAENVQNATIKLAKQLRGMNYKVFGNPEICTIGFSHPTISVTQIKQKMKEKGWQIPLIQKPLALHFSFTPLNSLKIDQMVSDIKQVTSKLLQSPAAKKIAKGSDAQLYGICAKIPDGYTRRLIMENVLDLFLEI